MSMNIKKSTPIAVAILSVALGAGGLVYYKMNTKVDKAVKVVPAADLQKAFLTKSNSRLTSPAGKAWQVLDFAGLSKMFGAKLTGKANVDFFQTAGFIWETRPVKIPVEKEAELASFQAQIVDFILSDEKTNTVIASHYALKALKKMPALCKDCDQRLETAYIKEKEKNRKDQYFEYLLSSSSPPDFVKKELVNQAKNEGQLRTVFSLISQIKDESFQKEIAKSIFKRLKKMSPAGQAISLKFFVYNRNLIQADLTDEVKLISDRDDDLSQDAFLNSVQQLNLKDQYKGRIKEISQKSPHLHIRSFAETLLQ